MTLLPLSPPPPSPHYPFPLKCDIEHSIMFPPAARSSYEYESRSPFLPSLQGRGREVSLRLGQETLFIKEQVALEDISKGQI